MIEIRGETLKKKGASGQNIYSVVELFYTGSLRVKVEP